MLSTVKEETLYAAEQPFPGLAESLFQTEKKTFIRQSNCLSQDGSIAASGRQDCRCAGTLILH
jgi:hypothetical protein